MLIQEESKKEEPDQLEREQIKTTTVTKTFGLPQLQPVSLSSRRKKNKSDMGQS
jgi:hypothetical protein